MMQLLVKPTFMVPEVLVAMSLSRRAQEVDANIYGIEATEHQLSAVNPAPYWLRAVRNAGLRFDRMTIRAARGLYVGGRRVPIDAFVDCAIVVGGELRRVCAHVDTVCCVRVEQRLCDVISLSALVRTDVHNQFVARDDDDRRKIVLCVGTQLSLLCQVRYLVAKASAAAAAAVCDRC